MDEELKVGLRTGALFRNVWLQALLMFSPQFEVLWGSSAMQSRATTALENAFPRWLDSYSRMAPEKRRFLPTRDGERVWPSSFWMRKLA